MKKLVLCLTAGLLVIGAQSLLAQTSAVVSSTATNTTTTTPGAHPARGDHERVLLRMLGLKAEELKGLTREARLAKMKTAAQTVITELEAKQSAGTLTPEGQTRLEHIQKWLANAGTGHKAGAGAGAAAKPTTAESN